MLALVPACERAAETTPDVVRHQRHEFTPTAFYNEFSATTPPALRVEPGDTIRAETIDAAGTDDEGVTRGKPGNPQTGPFHVVGAAPGDTLAVHITRLRLNRGWAISTDTLSSLVTTPEVAARMTFQGQMVRWRLDMSRGLAMREGGTAGLSEDSVCNDKHDRVADGEVRAHVSRGLSGRRHVGRVQSERHRGSECWHCHQGAQGSVAWA